MTYLAHTSSSMTSVLIVLPNQWQAQRINRSVVMTDKPQSQPALGCGLTQRQFNMLCIRSVLIPSGPQTPLAASCLTEYDCAVVFAHFHRHDTGLPISKGR